MKKKIIISVVTIIVAIIIIVIIVKNNKEEENSNMKEILNTLEEEYNQMKQNSKMYDENANIANLKEEYKMTGEDSIYEMVEEPDGRKILAVKSNLNVKVAFVGMIKNALPKKEEIDNIYEKNFPKNKGIYIESNDRDKILYYLNNSKYLKNKYKINNEGFVELEKENKKGTDYDKKIEKLIKGNKTYIVSINGTCYMIDAVTGEIVDNPYNTIDKKQMYEYFEYDNKCIIFITDSKNISQDDIFTAILNLNHN